MANPIQLSDEHAQTLGDELRAMIQSAESDASTFLTTIATYRDYLTDTQSRANPPWDGASELAIPYLKSLTLSLIAHLSPTLLGVDPILHYTALNNQSLELADPMESYMQRLAVGASGLRRHGLRAMLAALRDGTAVMRVCWKTAQQRRRTWQAERITDVDEATGLVLAQRQDIREGFAVQTVFDAPELTRIPVERFGTFPRANTPIEESAGVFCHVPMLGADIAQRVKAGIFAASGMRALMETQSDEWDLADADSGKRGIASNVGPGTADDTFNARLYKLTEVYYRFNPKNPKDPYTEDWRIVMHVPSGAILAAAPSPWWHGRRPFVALSPYMDCDGFYGDSVASSGAGQVQLALTTLLRLSIDAMAIGIAPEMLVDSSVVEQFAERIRKGRGPGGIIPVPGAWITQGRELIAPFSRNGYSPTAAIPLIEMLDKFGGQQATGVNENMRNGTNARDVTATEARQIMESSQKVLGYLTEQCADWVTDVGQLMHDLLYQYQGNEYPLALWDALHDDLDLDLYDAMQGYYDIASNGVRDTANRAIAVERAKERLAMLLQEPMVAGDVTLRYHLYQDYLRTQDTPNVERLMGSVEDWQMKDQMMRAQAQAQAQLQAETELVQALGGEQGGANGA